MRAALYARFSTENQREASIDDQFRACERVADAAGLDIVARFNDRGISGGTTQRPGYLEMVNAARSGAFQILVTEDISRLWRNRAEYGARSAEFEDLGVHLVTAVGDDTRRDGWGLILGIKQAIAEHQRREISYRTRRGLEGRALAGESTGGRCYGYRTAAMVDPEQARVVVRIFELAAAGASRAAIAGTLNTDTPPVFAPRGGSWRASTIGAILNNIRYTGQLIWGRTEVRGSAMDSAKKHRTRRQAPLAARTAPEQAIVPGALWAASRPLQAVAVCV